MTPSDLLAALTARGVELVARGDKLRFRPVEKLTADEVELIRRHKPVILSLLRSEGREAAPIIPGTEHFSIWVDGVACEWPEFRVGYHYDVRQPSRLRGLLSPRKK
jgi:TubC N-terminal docking domain